MMKSFFFPLLILLSCGAHAQLQRGSVMLGATLGSASINYNSGEFNVSAQPRVGYLVTDRLAIGAGIGVDYTRDFPAGDLQVPYAIHHTLTGSLEPFARIYFGKGAGRNSTRLVAPYLEIGGGATYSRFAFEGDRMGNWFAENYLGWTTYLAPGIIYAVSPSVALESGLKLTVNQLEPHYPNALASFSFGFQIFLGQKESQPSRAGSEEVR